MLKSPISVIYDSNGTEISVSQSQIVSGSSQSGLMIAGSSSLGGAVFFRLAPTGELFVTGNLQTTAVATQSVGVVTWSPTVTGAMGVTSWLANVTASVKVDQWSTSVTGAMGVTSWVSTVTASTREIGASTTNVSAANASTTNFTLLTTNPNRKKATFYKEGKNVCYLKLGSVASSTSYSVQLTSNGYYELPDTYTGQVDIIFSDNAAGNVVRVTDIIMP